MAKRGRPPKPNADIETLIMECLNDIERKELTRLAYLYVDIYIFAYEKICEFSANEDQKASVLKAAELALDEASTTVFTNLEANGIKILPSKAGRPISLDAVLRACFLDHIKRQGYTMAFGFEMLSNDIRKIPTEFGIKYSVADSTHLNHWRNYNQNKRGIAIIQFLQACLINCIKNRLPRDCYK